MNSNSIGTRNTEHGTRNTEHGTRNISNWICALLLTTSFAICSSPAIASTVYVNDVANNLATVNTSTGTITMIGSLGSDTITDIAFDQSGNLFGISFTKFYQINPANASATLIGFHGISGGNALAFGAGGTLYAAGNLSTNLFTINPITGIAVSAGNIGAQSAGDLVYSNGNLYMSSSSDLLKRINFNGTAIVSVTDIGSFGAFSPYGLASLDDGTIFGVSGTSIISINSTTGASTQISNYSGSGLSSGYGMSITPSAAALPDSAPAAPGSSGGGSLNLFVLVLLFVALASRTVRKKHIKVA